MAGVVVTIDGATPPPAQQITNPAGANKPLRRFNGGKDGQMFLAQTLKDSNKKAVNDDRLVSRAVFCLFVRAIESVAYMRIGGR